MAEAKAIAKYVRMSPIKLAPVTDLVRGKDLQEALNILKFTPGKGAEIVEKVVKSAAANAEENHKTYNEEMESWFTGQSINHLKEIKPRWRYFKRKRLVKEVHQWVRK